MTEERLDRILRMTAGLCVIAGIGISAVALIDPNDPQPLLLRLCFAASGLFLVGLGTKLWHETTR